MTPTNDMSERQSPEIAFSGAGGGLAGLSLRTGLLNLSTLFFYRFWARTQARRAIWSRISIDGDPLEYSGRVTELLFGALFIALVILVPLSLASFSVEVIRALWDVPFLILWGPFLYLVLRVLVGAALFRARRYRLRRTLWRGLRFDQDGNAWPYGLKTLGYFVLSVITLGWTIPLKRKALTKHVWRRTRLGDAAFSFEPAGEPVYHLFAVGWLSMVAFAVIGVPLVSGLIVGATAAADPESLEFLAWLAIAATALAYGSVILFAQWMFSFYEAAILRWTAKSLRLGEARFRLDLTGSRLAMLRASNVLLVAFTLGMAQPIAQARKARLIAQQLHVEGAFDAAAITAGPETRRDGGEGLADAFDLGAI